MLKMAKCERNFKGHIDITIQAKSKKQADYILYRLNKEMTKTHKRFLSIIEECQNEN